MSGAEAALTTAKHRLRGQREEIAELQSLLEDIEEDRTRLRANLQAMQTRLNTSKAAAAAAAAAAATAAATPPPIPEEPLRAEPVDDGSPPPPALPPLPALVEAPPGPQADVEKRIAAVTARLRREAAWRCVFVWALFLVVSAALTVFVIVTGPAPAP